MKLIQYLFVYLFLSLTCYAGDSLVGNGGNILFCKDKSSTYHLTTLDLYELSEAYKYTPYFDRTKSYTEDYLINEILNKLTVIHPSFAGFLKAELKDFHNNMKVIEVNFNYSNDIHSSFPKGCHPKTVIYQRLFYPYYIALPLFQKLSTLDRVALIFHEAIYGYAIFLNPFVESSNATRRLNAYLFSNDFFQTQNNNHIVELIQHLNVN